MKKRWGSMKSHDQRLIFSALFLSLIIGCATAPKLQKGDPSLPEIDVLQLKENSDEALKLAQENKLELQSLEAKVHELEGRMSTLGDELSNLPTAKLDELTQQMSLMTEQLRAMDEKFSKVPPPPPPAVKKGLATFAPTAFDTNSTDEKKPAKAEKVEKDHKAERKLPGQGEAKVEAKLEVKPEVKTKVEPRKPPASDVEAQLYKKAFDLYYGRDYPNAIAKFEELLQKFKTSSYADNCFYWIGECQFALGNFSKGITAFRKVLTFSETEKSDDAQLKLGYCYLRLGERKQAAIEFKKVVSLYPESEYTERAKEELAKLE